MTKPTICYVCSVITDNPVMIEGPEEAHYRTRPSCGNQACNESTLHELKYPYEGVFVYSREYRWMKKLERLEHGLDVDAPIKALAQKNGISWMVDN